MKKNAPTQTPDPDERIAELVRTLREAEEELQALTGGQLDAVVSEGRAPYLLRDAQEKLRVSEAAQRALAETQMGILNALPAHIALLGSEGVIVAVNEAWRRFASANALQRSDFFVGQNYLDVCDRAHGKCAEEARAVAHGIRRVLRGEMKEFSMEYPCHSSDEERWFRLMVTPLSETSAPGAVVMHVNVTERRLAEEILRKSEREQRRLAEELTLETRRLHESQAVANVGSWETDLATHAVTWSDETFRIFETSPEKYQPTHAGFLEFVHPEDRKRVDDAFVASLGQPGPLTIEHRLLLPGGKIKHVEERWQVFNDPTGAPIRAAGTCQDITKQVAARADLMQSEERFRRLYERVPDAIQLIDTQGVIFDVNPATETLTGYPRKELIGRNFLELSVLRGEHLSRAKEALMLNAAGRETGPAEYAVHRKDGQVIAMEFEGFPIRIGEQDLVLGVGRDITARKQAEERVARISRLYMVLSRVNEMIVRTTEASQIFAGVCRIAVENGRFRMAAIVGVDVVTGVVNCVAHSGAEDGFFSEIRINLADPAQNRGTIGTAIRTNRYDVCNDTESDQRMGLWRERMLRHGYRSAASFPVREAGKIVGVLVLFSDDVNVFHEEEVKLLAAVAEDVSFAIEALRSAKALRERQTLLSSAERIGRMGTWNIELECGRLVWSEATCELFGIQPADFRETFDHFVSFILPEDRPAYDACHARVTLENPLLEAEYRIRWPDGQVRWMYERGNVEFDADGMQTRRLGMVMDITERKKADADIAEANRNREIILSSVGEGIHGLNMHGRISFENPAALAMLGYSENELVGRDGHTAIHHHRADGSAYPVEDCPIYRTLQDGEVRHIRDELFFRKDGTSFPVDYVCSPLRDNSRALTGVVVAFTDVTERSLSAKALETSVEEFRTLAEAMPQIVWTTRPDGWTTYYNAQWVKYTGLPVAESLGHNWTKPFHPDDQQRAWEAWQLATSTGSPYSLECRLRRADGEYRWWLTRGEPLRDDSGSVLKWFGTCTDIHDRKLAELQISRSNRALRMLSACNEALVHAEDENELLQVICSIAVADGVYRMAWVGYALQDSKSTIQPMAHAGEETGYLSEADLTWEENVPRGTGPAGRTIRTGRAHVSEDIERDPSFHWLDAARRRSYRSVICLPLRDGSRTFGLLGLYSDETFQAGAEEMKLLKELAANLAFGILTLRARLERERLHEAVLAIARGVSASVGSEFFDRLNQHLIRALNADAGFIARLRAPDGGVARTVSAFVRGEAIENYEYQLAGTPCGLVVEGELCIFEQGLQQRFPDHMLLAQLGAESYAGMPLKNSEGEVVGLIAVLFSQPITQKELIASVVQIFAARAAAEMERQRADASVREQAALLDKAQDAIIVRNLDHRITYWNKGAERIFGWTAQEALRQAMQEFLDVDASKFAEADRTVRELGEWIGETEKRTKNGALLTIDARWTLLRDDAGRPSSILSIDTNITERKKLEQQFLRAQRMESIGTLAGGIAHDLNNCLGPIIMSLDLLKMHFTDSSSQQLLGIISSSAQRGADMVRQVLSFARGVEGERIELQLGHLVKDIEKIANETFLKHIQVYSAIPHDLWIVLGDATQLHQVLLNLCVNARDAMPEGGSLTISAENIMLDEHYAGLNPDANPGAYVCLSVEDSGAGMPPELIEKIFDPFFTTKEIGKGTGLGLSTTLAIVKSHGGFIRVYSEPGRGTTFKVYLPASTEASAGAAAKVAVEMPRGHGELILVIDDEASVRQITKQTLEAFGYRALLAADGTEAVATYAKNGSEIAVVITDMMMPLMDGPATIRVLRKMNPTVRIIAASGLAVGAHVAEASALGVKHVLPKPYTAETLLKALKDLLARER